MKSPSTPNQVGHSVYPDTIRQDKSQLKQAIKDFLSSAAATPADRLCPRCGKPMQYVDTVFWLYGDERSFPIRLQRCPCMGELSDLVERRVDATSGAD